MPSTTPVTPSTANQNRPYPDDRAAAVETLPMSSSAEPASAPDTFFSATLAQADPVIAAAIKDELGRQRHEIELIASENIVSRAVLEAQGSVMTNKYAEGYAGHRYYGGCEFVDVAEALGLPGPA